MTITGKNFYTSGFTASASFGGAYADSVEISDDTQLMAIWNNGLPPLGADIKP